MANVLIVGAGISGLVAACYAAKAGHQVKVLSYGQGALTVAGGIIDLYGYDLNGNLVTDPLEHIATLPKPHPYALVGTKRVEEAIEAFKELTASQNYIYVGDGHHNQKVPTAIGSFKPSCLIPPSVESDAIFERPKIVVVGFELLKDYYPKLIAKNLQHFFGDKKEVSIKQVMLHWPSGRNYRDVSALDIARELETDLGRLNFVEQLKGACGPDTALIIPPVLGERPELSASIQKDLEQRLNTKLVEVSSIPPSVTGLRLDKLLRNACFSLGVDIVEKAQVIGFTSQADEVANLEANKVPTASKVCRTLITGGFGHTHEYKADAVIVATGGFFSSGLVTQMGRMYEPIFGLEIKVPEDQKDWSHQYLFCGKPQPFASYGVAVNENLQPVDPTGEVVLSNVQFIGRSLQGYDFCFEKSGNGVAITTAYHAVKQLDEILAQTKALSDSLFQEVVIYVTKD